MADIEEVKEKLKNRLTEKRYNHSLGASKSAKELAKIYGEDEEKAEFTGLIHDIAKEIPKESMLEYAKKYNVEIDEIEKVQIGLLHAKLGAIIAREEFGADEKIQNAIKYHTTGNKEMDTFAKIIYLADKIEENRNYDGIDELRKLAKSDLDKAMLFVLDFNIQKAVNKVTLIHPDTVELRNMLLIKNSIR